LLSVHRYHQTSESTHLILNPFSIETLADRGAMGLAAFVLKSSRT
jgi:hypothetical protein